MKNLILKIYARFQSKFLSAFLAIMFLTVSSFAQGTGDSVVIINTTPAKGPADEVAHWAVTKIGAGLLDKFPCVDFASTEDIAAILGYDRMKELLGGGEPSPEEWQSLAGAVGARYIIVVSVTIQPNGQTIVSAKLLDAKTASTIADELETAANAEDALDNAESLANKLMQSFSNIFKNKCEPHWTGSITQTRLLQTATTTDKSSATSQGSETKSKNLSATVNIVLQPMTLGFSGRFSSQARVTQNYRYIDEFGWTQTGEFPCREPGRNTYYIKATTDFKRITTENGSGAGVETVFIRFYDDGRYTIYTMTNKPIKTTVKVETSGNDVKNCGTFPFSTARENEDAKNFAYISLEGRVDPKNPDVLTGKKVEGDLETGQNTWEWKLRLVTPNRKKALK
ncbi:MAG TPA: hypothetical protein VNB22_21660 [Pyrinomonadaceae bacterium]|nr:hypothetical protein [Pyrinomonadaceae bacterium]